MPHPATQLHKNDSRGDDGLQKCSTLRSEPSLTHQPTEAKVLPCGKDTPAPPPHRKAAMPLLFSEPSDRKFHHLPLTFLSNFFCFIFSRFSCLTSFASSSASWLPQTSRARLTTYSTVNTSVTRDSELHGMKS